VDAVSFGGVSDRLIASGDLHDNPVHLSRLVSAAGLLHAEPAAGAAHLVLHEIIHPDRLHNGLDFSFRALGRVAALKVAHPELVHTLLANHELAQMMGAGIVKDGVRCVEAFDEGLVEVFGDAASVVAAAIGRFVRSMPLALRATTPRGDLLCSHSLPAVAMMSRFDRGVLSRDLTAEDYGPRGSAHAMVWGRGYDAEQLEDLTEAWGVNLFLLGHEHAENGYAAVLPNALVLNSDHERGVYLPIDLRDPPADVTEAAMSVVPLASAG